MHFSASIRWSSYVAPKIHKGGLKNGGAVFLSKIALSLEKVCYIVFLCENRLRQSFKAFIGLTIHAKIIGGGSPLLPEILGQTGHVGVKSPIFFQFLPIVPAVTPSEKSSININRKSTTHFPVSPRWTSYVVRKPPKGAQKRIVSRIWTISCDNS